MFASIVIIGFSLVLFLYWFRYTCLLILSTKTTRDYTVQVARANHLEFPAIVAHLRSEVAVDGMDTLHTSLGRDYRLLTTLLRSAAQFQVGGLSVEQRMLMIDYHVMKGWYAIARRFSQALYAQQALEEMADIVAHLANDMGERAAARS
ncbi:MAG: hypothetical protein HY235_17730 [Acidobacteria bacterium]|nr:hypothetical protein [Acidobacteriota bacterium]